MSKRKVLYDLNDQQAAKEVEDESKDREKDLGFIMSQPRGRRWLYDMIFSKAHLTFLSHVPGDPHSSAFNEGARSVGKAVHDEVIVKYKSLYIKMLEENADE